MKYLLSCCFIVVTLLVLFPTHIFAAPPYPLSAVVSPTTIAVTMSNIDNATSEYELYDSGKPVSTLGMGSMVTMRQKPVNEKIVWLVQGASLKSNHTYYFHVVRVAQPSSSIAESISMRVSETIVTTTGTGATGTISSWPTVTDTSGQKATVMGKIDLAKYPYISNLKVELAYSATKGGFANGYTSIAHQTNGGSVEGVNDDGSYYFNLSGLTPSTEYYMRQIIRDGSTILETRTDQFNSSTGYTPVGSVKEQDAFDAKSYRLLAPFPGLSVLMDPDLCYQKKYVERSVSPDAICDINGLLNFMFKLMIGLTAVVLVLRLIYEGYQYMVTDVPYLKASAKSGFWTALGGLILALSAYLILNTINPKLVSNNTTIGMVMVGVEEFIITGPLTGSFNGKPIKVNFNKEAYPAAKIASDKTGVDVAFILAVFAQETGSGANIGACHWSDANARMIQQDIPALKTITTELGKNIDDTPVSCALKSNGNFLGYGGAIGYTQVLPSTWLEQRIEAKTHLGHMPSPWNTGDALMVTAVYLKKVNARTNEKEAACKYYAGPGRTCAYRADVGQYGTSVMGKKLSIQDQITKAKAKGEIQ